MRETCDTNGNSQIKRVSVRSGGAGHAHSGIAKRGLSLVKARSIDDGSLDVHPKSPKRAGGKIVKLGT
jgi:hypothetical protein